MESIYLDYASTGPLHKEALLAMLPFWQKEFGNSSSLHDIGQRTADVHRYSRQQVAEAIGATTPRCVLFTSGGTEANNIAILGTMRREPRGSHMITSTIEHPSVLEAVRALEKEGYEATYIGVNSEGFLTVDEVKNAIRPSTRLVSIMAANNETGTLQPIAGLANLLRPHDILLHTDTVQYFGKLPINVEELGVDMASLSAHKIYGPKGIGALYVRNGVRLTPILHGGGQERGLRPGTPPTPLIVGFGAASAWVSQSVKGEADRLQTLRNQLWEGMQSWDGVIRNGHPENVLPNLLNVSFTNIEGQAIMLELNRQQIYVSSSSACAAGKHAPSHVLMAMGRTEEEAYQSVRFSLGKDTETPTIQTVLHRLQHAVNYLRQQYP
ncbi:cysteine desulfurase family protein [Pasteuria penetrans]|uniref:cysteine desulfurase family protein n=1 Tax=Pasteuria penetrans TaxID=86005 RepID=UPI000FA98470|nr:cysteine desulfurase family protein [Pasteuria penetrans]